MKKAPKGVAPESRLSRLVAAGADVDLPPNPCQDLTDILMEAGPMLHTGMGPGPLTATELQAWQDGTGKKLTGWEFRMVLSLSRDYLGEIQAAADPDHPPPWIEKPAAASSAGLARHIRGVLRG